LAFGFAELAKSVNSKVQHSGLLGFGAFFLCFVSFWASKKNRSEAELGEAK
jgi:hypothetical protein